MLNQSKLLAGALIAATFVAGGLVGGAVKAVASGGEKPRQAERREPRPSYVDRLTSELALTPMQRDSLVMILERREDAMAQIWAETRPRFDSLRAQIRAEIAGLLSGAQRGKYDSLIAHYDASRRGDSSKSRGEGGRRDH